MLIIPEGQDHERHQKGTEWCIFAMDYIPIIIYVDLINNCYIILLVLGYPNCNWVH